MPTFRFSVLMFMEDSVDIEADTLEGAAFQVEDNLHFYPVHEDQGSAYPWASVEIQESGEVY
jgi:hypothetical protein